jgi:hypothetical protein|tara:strand:- start:483 stop:962 length:480 start_codon:yes stop_codon:yes gene_type:complete
MENPKHPYEYEGKQVVINSDRLLFNAKNDSIMVYSNKHMAFSANNHIHFDTGDEGNFAINSNKIFLGLEGDKNEPAENAVLGNQLEIILNDMCDMLEDVLFTLEFTYPPYCIAPPVGPNVPSGTPIFDVTKQQIASIRNNIPQFKSDRVKLPTDNMYGK